MVGQCTWDKDGVFVDSFEGSFIITLRNAYGINYGIVFH
jgi:hypothetical protein